MAYHYDVSSIVDAQWNEGTAVNQRVLNGLSYPQNVKLAQRRDGTIGSHALNGTVSATTAIATGTTPLSDMHLGGFSGTNVTNGHIRRLRYWPSALEDKFLKKVSV